MRGNERVDFLSGYGYWTLPNVVSLESQVWLPKFGPSSVTMKRLEKNQR